jgi:hypothetical protein
MDSIEHNFNLNYVKQQGQRLNIRTIIKALNLTIQESQFEEWARTNLRSIQPLEIQYDSTLGIYYLNNYRSKTRSRSIKSQSSDQLIQEPIRESTKHEETKTILDTYETTHDTTHRILREIRSSTLKQNHLFAENQEQQNELLKLLIEKSSMSDKTMNQLLIQNKRLLKELSDVKQEMSQLREMMINSDSRMIHFDDRLASVKRTVKEIPKPPSQPPQQQVQIQPPQQRSKSIFDSIF